MLKSKLTKAVSLLSLLLLCAYFLRYIYFLSSDDTQTKIYSVQNVPKATTTITSQKNTNDLDSKRLNDQASVSKRAESYLKFIDDANAGSAYAQYKISSILSACPKTEKASLLSIKLVTEHSVVDHQTLAHMQRKLEDCKAIYKLADGQNLSELSEAWLQTSIENGYTLSELKDALLNSPSGSVAVEVEKLLYKALEEAKDDVFLTKEAVLYTQLYLNEHTYPYINKAFQTPSTPQIQLSNERLERLTVNHFAWRMIQCDFSSNCDSNNIGYDDSDVGYVDIGLINQRAEELRLAISQKNWPALELSVPK